MFKSFKKIVVVFFVLFFTVSSVQAKVKNEVYGGIAENQKIYYSYRSDKWYYQRPFQKDKYILEVARKITGKEKYSEYISSNQTMYSPAGSNYEFLYNGRLISYHLYDCKLFEIDYDKKSKIFLEKPLPEKDIKKLLGNPKIIYISEFDSENNLTIKKSKFKRQWYLLLNDTDRYFYKYSLHTAQRDGTIQTLFYLKKPKTMVYSHSSIGKAEFPAYQIRFK